MAEYNNNDNKRLKEAGFGISLKVIKPYRRIVQLYFINVTSYNIELPSACLNPTYDFTSFVISPPVPYAQESTKLRAKFRNDVQFDTSEIVIVRPGELVKSDMVSLNSMYSFDDKREYKIKYVVDNYVQNVESGEKHKIFGDQEKLMSEDIVLPAFPPLSSQLSKRILKFSKKS